MFKRTKGYLLLTMLVLTGLAGRIHSDTISGKERRALIKELKLSKSEFIGSIENLSNQQLNFKSSRDQLSIKDCIYKLTSIEKSLWNISKKILQQEPLKQNKSFSDEELNSFVSNPQTIVPVKKEKLKNVKEALMLYKKDLSEMLKYANTSTANMRAFYIQTSCGTLDSYQLLFLNGIYARYYTRLITEIKSNPNFPK